MEGQKSFEVMSLLVNGGSEFRHLYKYGITDHIRLFVNTFSIAKFNYCAFKFVGGIYNLSQRTDKRFTMPASYAQGIAVSRLFLNIAF